MGITYAIGVGVGNPSRDELENEIRAVMGDLVENRMESETSSPDKDGLATISERLDETLPAMPTEQLNEALDRAASMAMATVFQRHRSEFSLLMREALPMTIMSAASIWANE